MPDSRARVKLEISGLEMRIAVKVAQGRFVLLDADEIYYVEGSGHDSLVRTFRKRRYRSIRSLAELERVLRKHGFLRVHRSFVVNLNRVREVRLRGEDDNDWELKLDPPVNTVLPVGRTYVRSLRQQLGV